MTRESLWTTAAPLAALSRPWISSGNAISGDPFVMPYANEFLRGRIIGPLGDGPWQVRLNEKPIPFIEPMTLQLFGFEGNQLPAIIPKTVWQGADVTSFVNVGDRVMLLFDVYQNVSRPFLDGFLNVSNGREMRCNRMKGFAFATSFGAARVITDVDFEVITEDVDGTARVVSTQYVSPLVMFVPRVDRVTSWGGVYVCVKHMLHRAFIPAAGVEIDYADKRLPTCCVVETGELVNGDMVARDSILIPGVGCRLDCGTGREDLSSPSGTKFHCTVVAGTTSVLEFGYVASDVDAQLCGIMQPVSSELVFDNFFPSGSSGLRPLTTSSYPTGFTNTPYSSIGECPAFEAKQAPDEGRLVLVSHFGGAATTPPFPDTGNDIFNSMLPKAAQWGTWQFSKYAYTPHRNCIITAEGPKAAASVDGLACVQTPVYGLRDAIYGELQTVEPFPEREVCAVTACLEGHAVSSFAMPYMENAGTLLKKNANNDLVVAGKRITGVTIQLQPYTTDGLANVRMAVDPVEAPEPAGTSGGYDKSETGWKIDSQRFWELTGTIAVPAGVSNFDSLSPIYNGIEVVNTVAASDGVALQSIAPGLIDDSSEKNAVLFEHAIPRVPIAIGGETVPETIAGLYGFDPFGLNFAPLTGEYSCQRFSLGNLQVAGNWFYFSGAGEWECEESVSYKTYFRSVTTNNSWQITETTTDGGGGGQFGGAGGGQFGGAGNTASVVVDETPDVHEVEITEDWSLETAHVEIHSILSVRLQEAGTFDPNRDFGFGDQREVIYAANRVFDQPQGRFIDAVTYTAGNEPRPALGITLYGRSVMKGTVSVSVDTTDLPVEWPWSLDDAGSPKVASMAGGIDGQFVDDVWQTLERGNDPFSVFEYQFNAGQTAALLDGQAVTATRWAEPSVDQTEPAVWDFGQTVRKYKVTIQLQTQNV